jgi:peroxiredoxin
MLGLSTGLQAREKTADKPVDPAALEKAKKEFVKKLGSQTARFEIEEIKEGFIFNGRTDRVILLVLWDKRCKSCIKDIPNLNRYLLDLRGKLDIIAVELSGMSSKELQQFAKDKKVLYTLISGKENREFVSAAMRKFGFGKDKNGQPKKEGLPFMVVMGYTGHTHAIIRGIPKDPADMERFLLKIVAYYEKKKAKEKTPLKVKP